MKKIFPFLFTIALLSSCKKEPHHCHHNPAPAVDLCAEPQIGMGDCITDSNYVKPLILGKWNWTQTSVWGQVDNPCTKNLNYTYEFLNIGKVKVYIGSIYSYSSDYTFVQTWTSEISITDTTMASIHPEIYNAHGAVRLCGNYLLIDNSPVDGPRIVFLREN